MAGRVYCTKNPVTPEVGLSPFSQQRELFFGSCPQPLWPTESQLTMPEYFPLCTSSAFSDSPDKERVLGEGHRMGGGGSERLLPQPDRGAGSGRPRDQARDACSEELAAKGNLEAPDNTQGCGGLEPGNHVGDPWEARRPRCGRSPSPLLHTRLAIPLRASSPSRRPPQFGADPDPPQRLSSVSQAGHAHLPRVLHRAGRTRGARPRWRGGCPEVTSRGNASHRLCPEAELR